MKLLGLKVPFTEKSFALDPDLENVQQKIKELHLGEAATYTPDIVRLCRASRQLIFVADDMLTGGKYHDYITETNLTGRWPGMSGYTQDDFVYLERKLGVESYPVALPPNIQPKNWREDVPWAEPTPSFPVAKIWGQVYAIRGFQFKKLDFIRENGVQFKRVRKDILIPNQKIFRKKTPEVSYEMTYPLECWMYVGIPEYFEHLIDNGFEFSPVRTIKYQAPRNRNWLNEYYIYNPNAKRQDY